MNKYGLSKILKYKKNRYKQLKRLEPPGKKVRRRVRKKIGTNNERG